MPPKPRGRSTTRHPKGPRSNSTASTKTEHSEHAKHPNDQQNGRRSSSRQSNNSRNSNRSNKEKQDELSPEEVERREHHKNLQKLINDIIAQMREKEMLKMLSNLHTNGMLDPAKCERALTEYKEIGAKITQDWEDAKCSVGYYGREQNGDQVAEAPWTSERKQKYDMYWRQLLQDKMSEFRKKYHLPPALSRSAMEEVVRKNINEIAIKRMLHESNDGSVKDSMLNLIEEKLKEPMHELNKRSRSTPYKPGSESTNAAGPKTVDSNAGEVDSSDVPGATHIDEENLPSMQMAFAPTLWPTEAYTRGQSLRYL